MNIKIKLESSCDESPTTLCISNVKESIGQEALITIDSVTGTNNIYVLLKDLKYAVDFLSGEKDKK